MNSHVLRLYKEQRAAGLQARQALSVANYHARMAALSAADLAFDWGSGGGAYDGESFDLELPGGFSIVATIHADDDYRDFDSDCSAPTVEPARDVCDGPHGYCHDGYVDRDGVAWWRVGDGWRNGWRTATDGGYPLRERVDYWRARGMARGPAWQQARADLGRYFDYWRDVYVGRESFIGVAVELRDPSGEVIGEESCWGFAHEDGNASAAEEFANECAHGFIREYAGLICSEYAEKTREHRAQSARVRAIASELRALRASVPGGVAPVSCAVLRDAMRAAFNASRDAMRRARALRGLLPAVADMRIVIGGGTA